MLLLAAGLGAVPAAAQSEAESSAPCRIVATNDEEALKAFPPGYLEGIEGPIVSLFGVCNGRGVRLGLATSYQVVESPELHASLVEAEWLGRRRVLLVGPGDDGRPMLDDLSASLAYQAGRSPTARIDDLALDFSGFPETGVIAIAEPNLGRDAGLQGARVSTTDAVPARESYDVAAYMRRDKAMRIAPDEVHSEVGQ